MSDPFVRLSRRIVDEVEKIALAVKRAQPGWHDFQGSGNDLFLDSVSLSLQGAYNGVEVFFELIALQSIRIDRRAKTGISFYLDR